MCPRKAAQERAPAKCMLTHVSAAADEPDCSAGSQPCHISALLGHLSRTKRLRARRRTTTEPQRRQSLDLGFATKPSPKFSLCPGRSSGRPALNLPAPAPQERGEAAGGRARSARGRPVQPGSAQIGPLEARPGAVRCRARLGRALGRGWPAPRPVNAALGELLEERCRARRVLLLQLFVSCRWVS